MAARTNLGFRFLRSAPISPDVVPLVFGPAANGNLDDSRALRQGHGNPDVSQAAKALQIERHRKGFPIVPDGDVQSAYGRSPSSNRRPFASPGFVGALS